MRLRGFAVAVCALASTSLVALAASAKSPAKVFVPDNDQPMQVYLVRSAAPGCEPNCPEWIAAQGRIDAATPTKFKRLLSKIGQRKLPVLISSAGGSVDDSLSVARMIRAKGLDVAVSNTAVLPCAPKDKSCLKALSAGEARGKAVGYHSFCASACAFVLAGGTRRFVGAQTLVGVHQFTTFETRFKVLRTYRVETRKGWFGGQGETKRTLISEKRIGEKTVETATKNSSYQKVKKFFSEMGVGGEIMELIKSATAKDIHWLSGRELRETHMATGFIDGEQLIAGALPEEYQGFGHLPGHKDVPDNSGKHDPADASAAIEADRLNGAATEVTTTGHAAAAGAH
jgi:hypothetical protein